MEDEWKKWNTVREAAGIAAINLRWRRPMNENDQHERGLKLRTEMFGREAVEKRMNAFGDFGKPLQHIINAYAYGDVWSRTALPLADQVAGHGGDDGGRRT